MTVYCRQSEELGHLFAAANVRVQLQSSPFYHRDAFLLVLSRQLPGLTTIDSFLALFSDADNAANLFILRRRIMAQLATMQTNVSGTLALQQARYKHYIDKNVRSLPVLTAGQMVHVNRPPLTTLAADR